MGWSMILRITLLILGGVDFLWLYEVPVFGCTLERWTSSRGWRLPSQGHEIDRHMEQVVIVIIGTVITLEGVSCLVFREQLSKAHPWVVSLQNFKPPPRRPRRSARSRGLQALQSAEMLVKPMRAARWKILLSSRLPCSWLIQDFSVPSPLIFTSTSAY